MAQTITTTQTTTSTRSGSQLGIASSQTNYNLGSYVTDVALQPYIRSRVVSFRAVNMRPGQTVHVFFDSVLVDAYCAPATLNSSTLNSEGQLEFTRTGNWGDAIVVGSDGIVNGQFIIPDATFRTGERILELADVTDLKDGADAITTLAHATFVGSALSVTKQGVTLTTINPEIRTTALNDATSQSITNIQNIADEIVYDPESTIPGGSGVDTETVIHIPGNIIMAYDYVAQPPKYDDPVAQTFQIKTPNGEAGLFLTSLRVYFRKKSSVGVTVYLCDTINGYPNSNSILPFSKVHIPASMVSTSDDGTTATYFTFEAPVFCATDTHYAFVVVPDNNDPDYQIFTAKLGDLDIASGNQMSSIPCNGNLFISGNQSAWTSIASEFIKFDLYIAIFNSTTGTAKFTNKAVDFLYMDSVTYANSSLSPRPGDKIYKASNSTPSTVNTSIAGTVSYFNPDLGRMYVENSTGLFTANTTVQVHRHVSGSDATNNTTTLVAYGNLARLIPVRTNAVVPRFAQITPAGTGISYTYSGYSNTAGADTSTVELQPETETELLDYERRVYGYSDEKVQTANARSVNVSLNLSTDSPLVSPVVDLIRSKLMCVGNIISGVDANIYDEFYNYGNSFSKYISPPITLASGQDAEDLQVIISAYRPLQSDILVYAKFLNAQDTQALSQKTWTLLKDNSVGLYSDFRNTKDFREFSYSVASTLPNVSISGVTVSVNTSSSNVIGTGSTFTSYLAVNRYVQIGTDIRRVTAVTNNTQFTVNTAFSFVSANSSIAVIAPPTTAYSAIDAETALTGTFAVSNTTNIVTGTGTAFTTEVTPGDILYVVGADTQQVVSVTNATSLTVQLPFQAVVSGAAGSIVTNAGLTYVDSGNVRYVTFKTFQIKIVLLSDNSARVPRIDDVRVLALQQ